MSTEMVPFAEQYPVLVPGSLAAELIRENVKGEDIGIGDLDRIKVPSGGGTSWSVPTLSGDNSQKHIEGIMLHCARRRAYWQSTDPSNEPPDCQSVDMLKGRGDPSGECASCPLNEWESARKSDGSPGRGKACKESLVIFMLTAGDKLPKVVAVPPSSLKPLKQYRLRLEVPYFAAVTRLSLKKEKNRDGIAYAEIVPELVGTLSREEAEQVAGYRETLATVFAAATVERRDVDAE